MEEASIPLRTFSAPRMASYAFWLENAPRRRMDNIFKSLSSIFLIYMDDIFIFFRTIDQQHKEDVKIVTEKCIEHGVVLGENKCYMLSKRENF